LTARANAITAGCVVPPMLVGLVGASLRSI
jgi:hypothetical protein